MINSEWNHDDFFLPETSKNYSYYKIPKTMFDDPRFDDLTTEAKMIYGIFCDRVELSTKNGWVDEYNHVYIIFTISELMAMCRWGKNKIIKLFKELEVNHLIYRKRNYLGCPDWIFVRNIHPFALKSTQNNSDSKGFQNQTPRGLESKPQGFENQTTEVSESNRQRFQIQTAEVSNSNRLRFENQTPYIMNSETEYSETDYSDTERANRGALPATIGKIPRLTNIILTQAEQEMFDAFLYVRKNAGKNDAQPTIDLLVQKLYMIGHDEVRRLDIIEKSIQKGWIDFYPLDSGVGEDDNF